MKILLTIISLFFILGMSKTHNSVSVEMIDEQTIVISSAEIDNKRFFIQGDFANNDYRKGLYAGIDLHKSGLLLTGKANNILFNINTDLRREGDFVRVFKGPNFSILKEELLDNQYPSTSNYVEVKAKGIGILYGTEMPDQVSCKCIKENNRKNDCHSGGEGATSCSHNSKASFGSPNQGCSITCGNSDEYACCAKS